MHKKSLEAAAHFENVEELDENDDEDSLNDCKLNDIQNNQLSDKINKSFSDKKDKTMISNNSSLINKNHLNHQHISSTTPNHPREESSEDETLLNKSLNNITKIQPNFQNNNSTINHKLSQTLRNDTLHLQPVSNLQQQLFQLPQIHNTTALIDSTNNVYPLQSFHYNSAI